MQLCKIECVKLPSDIVKRRTSAQQDCAVSVAIPWSLPRNILIRNAGIYFLTLIPD